MHESALWQEMLLKYGAHGLDIEFRRQVHHGEIFVVEGLAFAEHSTAPDR